MIGKRRAGTAAALAGLIAAPGTGAWAQQQEFTVDATAGAGYSTNPLLSADEDTDAASVELSVTPRFVLRDERGATTLEGRFRHTEYFGRYSSAQEYGAALLSSRRLSERLTAEGELRFDSFIIGQRRFNPALGGGFVTPIGTGTGTDTGTVAPPGTNPPIDPVIVPIDVTQLGLVGLRERQNLYSGRIAASYQLSTVDSVQASANVSRTDYGGNFDGLSFNTYGGSLGYSRALSARTQVGVRGAVQQVDYELEGAESRISSLQGTITTKLSPFWSLSGAAGVQRINRRIGSERDDSTGLAGSVSACRVDDRLNFCARAFREAAATGLGDVTRVYGAGVDGSYRLSQTDVIRGYASYSNSDTPTILNSSLGATTYLDTGAAYERIFTRRLTGGVALGYRDAYDSVVDRAADLSIQVFLRTRIGDLRDNN